MKKLSAFLALSLLLQSVVPAWAQFARVAPVEVAPSVGAAAAGIAAPLAGATGVVPALSVLSASPLSSPSAVPALSASAAALPAAAAPVVSAAAFSASAASAVAAVPAASPAAAVPGVPAADVSAPRAAAASPASAPALAPKGKVSSIQSLSAAAVDAAAAGAREFDGSSSPALEPATSAIAEPSAPQEERVEEGENVPQRPQLSFQPAAKAALHAFEPGASMYGAMKLVKDSPFSREYWNQYSKGAEIDVVIRGESVFSRPTKITFAATKRIGDLTREDFEGTVPAHMIQVGVRELRRVLMANLEENRKRWSPEQPPVSLDSKVRVVKFQSYLELFKQANGPDAVPTPDLPTARTPLKVKAEGPLERMSYILPRAVYLDLDMFDGPVSKDILADMAKLQRTGVYFVALSRKPYAEANGIKEKLVKQLSAYQLSVLMPIRFLMVSDDGAVISELPRGGSPVAVDVLRFTPAEIDVLRSAVARGAEQIGIKPRAVAEVRQPPLVDTSDNPFNQGKPAFVRPDPRVRFEAVLPKMTDAQFADWRAAFDGVLAAQGLKILFRATALPDGRRSVVITRTDLAGSMRRLADALGEQFALYMNPGDALVLTRDPALMAANSKSLDFGKITGLQGAELAENALGLMLGEHRENVEGDLSGSATRIISFSRDRHRYLSEALIQVDMEEQNINFFSGHVVHAAEDWLIYQVQNGRIPSKEEFAQHLRDHWNAGMREFKAVGMPPAHLSEGWLNASLTRALSMYDIVVATKKRGEVIAGSEIPNFFVLKDYERRSGKLKRRYTLHTIFDFIALRPDPNRPGHATLVIYDFKTGPAKTRPKLNKDVQVLTYALFAHEKWVGKKFPTPYFSGDKGYVIDDVSVEFIYNKKLQPTDVTRWSLDGVRRKIIGTLNRIDAAEKKLYGYTPGGKPVVKKPTAKKPAGKATAKKAAPKMAAAKKTPKPAVKKTPKTAAKAPASKKTSV